MLPTGLTYISSNPLGTVDPSDDHKIVWTVTDPALSWEITLKAYMDGEDFGEKTNQATVTATIKGRSITKTASSTVNILRDPEAIITQVMPPLPP